MIIQLNNKFRAIRSLLTGMIVLILTIMTVDSFAQCGNSALVCNNLVRVSLDTSCTAVITPDVILKGANIDTSLYRVELRDPQGNPIPGNIITEDYEGAKLEVRVYCEENNLYCWGNIIVEDKIKPTICIEPIDTAVTCLILPFELDTTALLTKIVLDDNGCEKPDTLAITQFEEDFPCEDTVKIIRRIFSTWDAAGNRCDTTQTIYLLRAEIKDITFPKDTVIDCLDEADLSIAKLGEPFIGLCEHFEINYQDVEIPVCGVARKILRRWTVIDICTANDTIVTQVIKIEDNHAPEFDFSNFDIPIDLVLTDKFNCTADIIGINNPIITDCNLEYMIQENSLRVFYQLADDNGNLFGQLFAADRNEILSDPTDDDKGIAIWDLLDIPVGVDFRVIFVADDGCGNIARDTSMVFQLPDTSPPSAVCEGNTTVVLNNNGVTEVWAESFDDNSFDNCGIVKRQVRRLKTNCDGYSSDTQFGDSIHFCCDDVVNNPVKVVFRVFDAAGGFSDCIVNVFVQDKRRISITCGPNLQVNCGTSKEAVENLINNNRPGVTWVCGEKSLTPDIPDYEEDACGNAFFVVVWTAMDQNGQMDSCTQTVTISNQNEATVVRPPLSIPLNTCAGGTHPDSISGSRPTVNNVDCENIAMSWEDVIFSGAGSYCTKINRTWTVIDWCKFNGGNLTTGIIDSFTQVILISDFVKPVFTTCPDPDEVVVYNDTDQDCQEQITIPIHATDDCTPEDELVYSYVIDENNDGTVGQTFNGSTVTNIFPVGKHKIIFIVEDKCGNRDSCNYVFIVKSLKPPIPLCVGLTEAIIGQDGTVTISAESLNVKSEQGCVRTEEGLIYSFNQEGTEPTITFRCGQDIPNGIFNEQTLELWVVDTINETSAACDVIFSITDRPFDICADNIVSSALSGYITDEDMAAVGEVPVTATSMATGLTYTVETDEFGYYKFPDLTAKHDYKINPVLDGYPLAGVSTLDIVMIQQHILGLRKLTSPYKLLAADVNNSNSITALDLVALRQLILGHKNDIPNDNWKFVDRKFEFDMLNDPWRYQDHIMVYDAKFEENDNDFIGLKVGDVNGNAFIALAQELSGPRSTTQFQVKAERNGNIIRYAFSANDVNDLIGLQLAIQLDDDLDVVVIGSDRISLGEEHFTINADELRLSWSDVQPQLLDGRELFFVDMKYHGDGIPELTLNNETISAEMYNSNLETSAIALDFLDASYTQDLNLMQNKPNPFSDNTNITFQLPESGSATFTVRDVNGKIVYNTTNLYNKGINTINLDARSLGHSGVYYYTVTTTTSKKTRRMIVLH